MIQEFEPLIIPDELFGLRLDQVLVKLYPHHSRSKIQAWIKSGEVTIDQKVLKSKTKVSGGEQIEFNVKQRQHEQWQAQEIALDIVFEDEHLIIVNKPIEMVVHPAPGHYQDTLLNGLLHHHPDLINIPRAGIVHRLDKNTTGLLVIAKTLTAHTFLVDQLQQRAFEREYYALVIGDLSGGGTIDTLYGRHPKQRKKMAVLSPPNARAKQAITHYSIGKRYAAHTLLKVKLETGRTHQIRVHMAYKKLPIVGDAVYGNRIKFPPKCSDSLKQVITGFTRQALHACKLGLIHPETKEFMLWTQKAPDDFQQLLDLLEQNYNEQ